MKLIAIPLAIFLLLSVCKQAKADEFTDCFGDLNNLKSDQAYLCPSPMLAEKLYNVALFYLRRLDPRYQPYEEAVKGRPYAPFWAITWNNQFGRADCYFQNNLFDPRNDTKEQHWYTCLFHKDASYPGIATYSESLLPTRPRH
jgi:hypothetical protein